MTSPDGASSPSNAQVKKAGSRLRKSRRGEPVPIEQVEESLTVVRAFRAAHSGPLVTANNGLRSMVRSEGCTIEVSQRLKRMHTILDKLSREPTLSLANMQDIGGVRAVVDSVEKIWRVEARLRKNRLVTGYSDYINNPRSSGYRGVHVIVDYGGRQIEVQLRTHTMHTWALMVEGMSSRMSANLKQDGSSDIQLLMAAVSDAMASQERNEPVAVDTLSTIKRLREQMFPHEPKDEGDRG